MEQRLFLYIDILGFSKLVESNVNKLRYLYTLIDCSNFHYQHYKTRYTTIIFSDTIVVYDNHANLPDCDKMDSVYLLIKLVNELFCNLSGADIFFKAIITEGAFYHYQLNNIEAYFGQALVESYLSDKTLPGTGLFLDTRLRNMNEEFMFKPYSELFDYIILTDNCTYMIKYLHKIFKNLKKVIKYPIEEDILRNTSFPSLVYPEIVFFNQVYDNINKYTEQKIIEKYVFTWGMYSLAYPGLLESLVKTNFNPCGLSTIDWSFSRTLYECSLERSRLVFEENNP